MKVLVTGSAGFIGFSVAKMLLNENIDVVGIDNINSYYDVKLKYDRVNKLKQISSASKGKFKFYKFDICDQKKLKNVILKNKINYIIHLAAQAGVRHSIKKPHDYIESNIRGFVNILEEARYNKIQHLLFASTSSVYGLNAKIPSKEKDNTDYPIQLYAATKKSNELMAHAYSYLYNLRITGMRFFTVYGPWGRPDMALFKFVKSIYENKPIKIFNFGNHKRNFTYIDDICKRIVFLLKQKSKVSKINKNKTKNTVQFKIYNIGNEKSISLLKFIKLIEKNLKKKSKRKFFKKQLGDVVQSKACMTKFIKVSKIKSYTKIEQGIKNFIDWYKIYYLNNKIKN